MANSVGPDQTAKEQFDLGLHCLLKPIFLNTVKISQLRPLKIKTTSLFRPVFASPKSYLPYDIVFDIKTTTLIRPLFGSPKSGLKVIVYHSLLIIYINNKYFTLL